MEDRDLRLDLVRTFAILGVVTLHVVAGVGNPQISVGNIVVTELLLAISRCSVNLFGLLSGYLKIDREQHNASILKILFETIFWCLIIALVAAVSFNQNTPYMIVKNLFPILSDRLWYITAYLFVFLMSPFVNVFVCRIKRSTYKKLLVVLLVLMCIIPTIIMIDPFVNRGYSAGWLLFLYLLGGYYKKYGINIRFSKKKALVVLTLSICLIAVGRYALILFRNILHHLLGIGEFVNSSVLSENYNSPLVLLNSVLILYLCLCLPKINNNIFGKSILFISNVSLGIYIIHAHPFVLDYVLTQKNLSWAVFDNPFITLLVIFGLVLVVSLSSGFFEQIRIYLFKLCRINLLTKRAGKTIDSILCIEKNN